MSLSLYLTKGSFCKAAVADARCNEWQIMNDKTAKLKQKPKYRLDLAYEVLMKRWKVQQW